MNADISRLARALVLLAALGGGPVLAATEPYYQPHYCNNAFTYQKEIAEGKKAAQQVYKQMKVLPDSSPITQYVRSVGERLVAYAPGYKWPYNFHVVQDKSINAFALPGGPIFVNTGLIAAAQNESELAGVMAHEISHVVQRHATTKSQPRPRRANPTSSGPPSPAGSNWVTGTEDWPRRRHPLRTPCVRKQTC